MIPTLRFPLSYPLHSPSEPPLVHLYPIIPASLSHPFLFPTASELLFPYFSIDPPLPDSPFSFPHSHFFFFLFTHHPSYTSIFLLLHFPHFPPSSFLCAPFRIPFIPSSSCSSLLIFSLIFSRSYFSIFLSTSFFSSSLFHTYSSQLTHLLLCSLPPSLYMSLLNIQWPISSRSTAFPCLPFPFPFSPSHSLTYCCPIFPFPILIFFLPFLYPLSTDLFIPTHPNFLIPLCASFFLALSIPFP